MNSCINTHYNDLIEIIIVLNIDVGNDYNHEVLKSVWIKVINVLKPFILWIAYHKWLDYFGNHLWSSCSLVIKREIKQLKLVHYHEQGLQIIEPLFDSMFEYLLLYSNIINCM